MKKHKFTDEEHFAIWRAYGQKCFYCEQPLAFAEITIDHLIPELWWLHGISAEQIDSLPLLSPWL